jgi:replicative DNA helicase
VNELLTDNEIAARVAALRGEPEASTGSPRLVRPLTDAADSLIESLRIEQGIGLGLAEIDVLTRGFRPSDLVLITGFAHSGKTQLVNTMIFNNPNKRVLFFTLDDPAEMILAKLVAMDSGISSEVLEQRVRTGDDDTIKLIREAAASRYSNLLVVDEIVGINAMQDAVQEAHEHWGALPDAVVIDYLEMMPGAGPSDDQAANVKTKANSLKSWAKVAEYPLIVLHQGSRSNAHPGDPITLLSMGFSGEQQATIVLGCRRKRDRSDLEPHERRSHENTITVHVVKNKRPGGRPTHFEGIDFTMWPETGLIQQLQLQLNPQSATARAQAFDGVNPFDVGFNKAVHERVQRNALDVTDQKRYTT